MNSLRFKLYALIMVAWALPTLAVYGILTSLPVGPETSGAEFDDGVFLLFAALSLLSLLICLLVAWKISANLERALRDLSDAARRVGTGRFDTTLSGGGSSELVHTATAFNRMVSELKDARSQLHEAEKVAAWQEIARRLAHEIKNPLSPIQTSMDNIEKAYRNRHDAFDEILEESLALVREEIKRLRRILDEFSQFATLPSVDPTALDVRTCVSHATRMFDDGEVLFDTELPSDVTRAWADREQLTQVLINIIKNATESARSVPEPRPRISVRVESREDGVWIQVDDNGSGMDTLMRSRAPLPYVTTKDDGTGLGLAISARIIEEHGGKLILDKSPLGGTSVRIRLRHASVDEATHSMR